MLGLYLNNIHAHLPSNIQAIITRKAIASGRIGLAWNLADYSSADVCDTLFAEIDHWEHCLAKKESRAERNINPFNVPAR